MDENIACQPTHPWRELRANGPEDGAAAFAIATGMTFHQQKANVVDLWALFGNKFQGLFIMMYGDTYGIETCADDDAFGFDLIGYRQPIGGLSNSNGSYNPPIQICSAAAATAIVGTARASGDGGATETGRWMDAVTLSNDEWPNGINEYGNGHNTMLTLEFASNGIRYIYPWVHGALGAVGGETPGVGMIISAY